MRIHRTVFLAVFGGVVCVALVCVAVIAFSSESHRDRRGINKVEGVTGKVIALTIDDGPDPRFTPDILGLLESHSAKASFFMLGQAIDAHPDLARVVRDGGHEIGNHTYGHLHYDQLTEHQAAQEVNLGTEAIRSALGNVDLRWARAPRGKTTPETARALRSSGLQAAGWTVCLENKKSLTPQDMADRVLEYVEPGAIILMHDGDLDRTNSVLALEILLTELAAQGYRVTTLSELVDLGTAS